MNDFKLLLLLVLTTVLVMLFVFSIALSAIDSREKKIRDNCETRGFIYLKNTKYQCIRDVDND